MQENISGNNSIQVHDEETGQDILINNPQSIYGPVLNEDSEGKAYVDTSCSIVIGNSQQVQTAKFSFPQKPQEDYELAMWDTIDEFEKNAWSADNVGLKSGFPLIDSAFNGGIFPGFSLIAGDSNIGKTAFLSQLAWQISINNDNVYVMDFSLDDSMNDKLSRVAACAGQVIINCVKTPRNYQNYPLMLARRKNTILKIRENTSRYRAYDAEHFSTFIEDIEEEIKNKLVEFDAKGIDKKLVVCIDNFHDLNMAGKQPSSDKEKFDSLAQWCADLAKQYNIPIICTAEMKKLNGSRRPQLDDIREAVKIKYEAKAVMLVYNELHYKEENADIFFMRANNPFKQPIFEVHFAKNKFHTYKGRVFFEFYPEMALMKECDSRMQETYKQIVYG